jgi:hypothetical protein
MEIHAIGIDLGKTLFHLVAVDSAGGLSGQTLCPAWSLRKEAA